MQYVKTEDVVQDIRTDKDEVCVMTREYLGELEAIEMTFSNGKTFLFKEIETDEFSSPYVGDKQSYTWKGKIMNKTNYKFYTNVFEKIRGLGNQEGGGPHGHTGHPVLVRFKLKDGTWWNTSKSKAKSVKDTKHGVNYV